MTNRPAHAFAHSINGVPGRMFAAHLWPAGVVERAVGGFSTQTWLSDGRRAGSLGYGQNARLHVSIRWDDNCKNGHPSFAVTATISGATRRDDNGSIGCNHEEIAKRFPELAHLIRWHLAGPEGPWGYMGNALYLAGDRDYNGRRAGDVSSTVETLQFGDVPMRHRIPRGLGPFLREIADYDPEGQQMALTPVAVAHVPDEKTAGGLSTFKFAPKYQFAGQPPLRWHECAFDTEEEAERFAESFIHHAPTFHDMPTAWSEGKARELDSARRTAVWPEATDEQLSAPREELESALAARLPGLLAAMRADIEACGFAWSADELGR